MSSQKSSLPEIISIDHTLIESDIFENEFLCNLGACKGACCVKGASGAPLEEEEKNILSKIYPKVIPYMRKKGVNAVEEQGVYIERLVPSSNHRKLPNTEAETPLVDGKECAYVFFETNGTAKCAIEKAYESGDIDFKKPISCHLYPIRLEEDTNFTRLRYDRWSICNPACTNGKKVGLRIFQFLREALIRKFGEAWYNTLCQVFEAYFETGKKLPQNAQSSPSSPNNSIFNE